MLFPDEMKQQQVNPATMFASSLSAKEFFSIVQRRMNEYYKLNLFDVHLDSFEAKTWFGNHEPLNTKQKNIYYGYIVASQFNGTKSWTPWLISHLHTLFLSTKTGKYFREHPVFFQSFLMTCSLIPFLFISGIKQFPHPNKEENFNRFVTLFMELFLLILRNQEWRDTDDVDDNNELSDDHTTTENNANKEIIQEIIENIHTHSPTFFSLFYLCEHAWNVFWPRSESDFLEWLLSHEYKKGYNNELIQSLTADHATYKYRTAFSDTEEEIFDIVFPYDGILSYLYKQDNLHLIIDELITPAYGSKKLSEYRDWFAHDWDQFSVFLQELTNHTLLKNNFWNNMQQFIAKYRSLYNWHEIEKDINEFMSSINDEKDIDVNKIPESIKNESRMMENLLNFYISLMWSFWIAREDSFIRRRQKPALLQKPQSILAHRDWSNLHFYGNMLYHYSKNTFYYQHATNQIKEGKYTFHVPFKSQQDRISNNSFVLDMFDETTRATLLWFFITKDITLGIQQKDIISYFNKEYSSTIQSMTNHDDPYQTIMSIYEPIDQLLHTPFWADYFAEHMNTYHWLIPALKDSLYYIDTHIFLESVTELGKIAHLLKNHYHDMSILWIVAHLRQTLRWFLLLVARFQTIQKENNQTDKTWLLWHVYLIDILWIEPHLLSDVLVPLQTIYHRHFSLLTQWMTLDDNIEFVEIIYHNWTSFTEGKEYNTITEKLTGEDMLWLRWLIKHISYYNKRFLAPSFD